MIGRPEIDFGISDAYLRLAAANIGRQYPNAPATVVNGPADALTPRELHPAFYGSYDWHSCVHQHWLVTRLLRLFPDLPSGDEARDVVRRTLTPMNIWSEIAYLQGPNRETFERTYGWAWLLELARELDLASGADTDARTWREAVTPLVDLIVERWSAFLPKAAYPNRSGTHPNSAFGFSFLLEYGRHMGNETLVGEVVDRARSWFGADEGYGGAARFEPSGADFLSPALAEADLMARVLPLSEFVGWFDRFLGEPPASLLSPATVTDRADGHLVHLDGLNLTRAWHWRRIANRLPADDRRVGPARAAAELHLTGRSPGCGRASSWASTGSRPSPSSPSPTPKSRTTLCGRLGPLAIEAQAGVDVAGRGRPVERVEVQPGRPGVEQLLAQLGGDVDPGLANVGRIVARRLDAGDHLGRHLVARQFGHALDPAQRGDRHDAGHDRLVDPERLRARP